MQGIMNSFINCLRPVFTDKILNLHLLRREAVNIHGAPGIGKSRLLRDIRDCGIDGAIVIYVNMKSYKQSYDGFIGELQLQAGIDKFNTSLSNIIEELKTKHSKILFLLDNYDAILANSNIDKKYDTGFYNTLNALKNNSPVFSLLCVTKKPIVDYPIILNEKTFTSWLELTSIEIPPLEYNEIEQEVARKLPEISAENMNFIVDAVYDNEKAYKLLTHLFNDIIGFTLGKDKKFKDNIKRSKKKFEKYDETVTIKGVKLSSSFEKWMSILGPGKSLLQSVSILILKLLGRNNQGHK
jgi:hypothetical protein